MDEGTRSFDAGNNPTSRESVNNKVFGWDEGAYIISCLPHLEKMLQKLRAKEIIISPGKMNLSFIKDQKVYSMSWHNVYRFSGRAVVYKEGKDENSMIPTELTYPMYLDMIIKPLIEKQLLHEE